MNKLSVSVLMPIYNPRPDDLKRAIISVINQTYNHDLMKFIIIDDGSTNNSYKIAKTYQKKYN
jgi:glycosyltransferase involved in cell wall biosynthesis